MLRHTKDNAKEMLFIYSILGILEIFVNSMLVCVYET